MRILIAAILVFLASYFFSMSRTQPNHRNIVVDLPEEIDIANNADSFNAVLVGDTLFITFKK